MRPQPWRIVALFGLILTASAHAADPPSHEVRLADGRIVDFTAHYDRNSLGQSVRVRNKLFALTTSHTLLLFELPEIRLIREQIATEEITCLNRGEGETILVGLKDGRVCRVAPESLELTNVVTLPDPPAWIGWSRAKVDRSAGLIVATRPTKKGVDIDDWEVPFTQVRDIVTGKIYTWEEEATSFLLDRSGMLWLGADRGEFGGRVARIDLVGRTMTTVKPPPRELNGHATWEGIYGFAELRDGRILAFGGTIHFGYLSGFVAAIEGDEARSIFRFKPPWEREATPGKRNPDRPQWPITHVVEEGDGLRVFSYGDVFRADRALRSWKKVASVDLQYVAGRPDAMGSYPAIRTVHPPQREDEPYLLATSGDGYVSLDGARAVPHRLPGQFGGQSGASRIQRSAEGILVYEDEPETTLEDTWVRHTWRFDAKGWTLDPFNPPFELDPLDQLPKFGDANEDVEDVEPEATAWRETQVMVGPNGAIFTVSANDRDPGTRTTARWVDGKSVCLGREVSSLDPSSSFITGDGHLWNAAGGELQQFDQGLWETVAEVDTRPLHPRSVRPDDDLDVQEFAEARAGHSRISPIESKGPPWLLRDRFGLKLWQLAPKAAGAAPLMSPLTDRFVQVNAAIPLPDGSLRLATENGLKTFDMATKTVLDSNLPAPPPPLSSLTTDGLGRLWIGGERGLGMVKEDGKTLESFDEVPWLRNQEVLALAPDPNHGDGVIVGLGWRGVMFIQVKKEP